VHLAGKCGNADRADCGRHQRHAPELLADHRLLIRGGEVYDHDGDVHKPAVADILVEDGDIVAVGRDLAVDGGYEVIDAADRLVVPGSINAHYHSLDTLCRGLFEELPLECGSFTRCRWASTAARRRYSTPPEIIDKLNREINSALLDARMRVQLADLSATVMAGSPAAFRQFIVDETEKWEKVVKFSGAKPD